MKKVPVRLRKAASPIPEAIIDKIFDNNTGETVSEPETDSKLFKPNFLLSCDASPPKIPKLEEKLKSAAPVIIEDKKTLDETNEIVKAKEQQATLEELEAQKYNFISTPSTGPQFYGAWKEFNDVQRFLYLKNISDGNTHIGKLLGAQLDSCMLSEIIHTVHKYFPSYNLPFIRLLNDLGNNIEVSVLALFLEEDDKKSKFMNFFSVKISQYFAIVLELNELLVVASACGDNAKINMIQEIKNSFEI
jgi:hypothetical protein